VRLVALSILPEFLFIPITSLELVLISSLNLALRNPPFLLCFICAHAELSHAFLDPCFRYIIR
jgi:hypothetical protein